MTLAPLLVLASRSSIRGKLLSDAGLSFTVDAADVDEAAIGQDIKEPAARALALAVAKARAVSSRHAGALVLGVDQVGVLEDGSFLEKPRDVEDHVRMLLAMADRAHTFHVAAALVVDGQVRATVGESTSVRFRALDERTARAYVATGEGAGSCGGYESEHRGAQLIARIDGSLHVVLGLPLLGVLASLRELAPGLMLPVGA